MTLHDAAIARFGQCLDGSADIVKGFDVGAIDYVTKPICRELPTRLTISSMMENT